MNKPDPFLTVRVHHINEDEPGYSGLCTGYEGGKWRASQLVHHAMEWLPEFALSPEECTKMGSGNGVAFIRRAAKAVYDSGKFKRRGEFGELFLHMAVRQVFDSIPAISKIFYKTAVNDTVKGFDAVHVVSSGQDLELWIGEAKFYRDIDKAIYDVVKEIHDHTQSQYLRSEFTVFTNMIDDASPHATALRELLNPNTSLDEIFTRICIPVLLTYESPTVANNMICDESYVEEFEAEIVRHYNSFVNNNLPTELRIHLFLLPLDKKEELISILDDNLKIWQQI